MPFSGGREEIGSRVTRVPRNGKGEVEELVLDDTAPVPTRSCICSSVTWSLFTVSNAIEMQARNAAGTNPSLAT